MIDFSLLPRRNKTYAGANGSKIAVMYEDELYMLKFPGVARKNKDMSYANGCICEYLGCHIFEIAGIPVQKTMPGTNFPKYQRKDRCGLQGFHYARYRDPGFRFAEKYDH